MAATRLIAMHQNKGRSLQKCLKDRTDYAQNPEKTEGGELVSSYQCDPEFVEEQFASSKKEYLEITGRKIVGDIIAYQIRQSFKPGEITPEEANKIGYETAMRWTKGQHAFIVATHVDKAHMEYKAVHQVENFDNDWYEYVEYGTTNPITIFLQQNGFSREASIYIQTPSNYSKYVTDVDGEKKIKRSILECGNIGVETEAQDIQFNIPELFVE